MELIYGNGEVRLNANIPISAIKIRYKGMISAQSTLPKEWIIMANKRIIVAVNVGGETPELLFTYIGKIIIIGCEVFDENSYRESITYKNISLDFWERQYEVWEKFGKPDEYSKSHVYFEIVNKFSFMQINLKTDRNEFYYKNGDNYQGDYHVHNNGQAMTGAKHGIDPKNIYRIIKEKKVSEAAYIEPITETDSGFTIGSRKQPSIYTGGGETH